MKSKETFMLIYTNNNQIIQGLSLVEAHTKAQLEVGNKSYIKPIPGEDTYLYGPGDGTTSIMIRREIDWNG